MPSFLTRVFERVVFICLNIQIHVCLYTAVLDFLDCLRERMECLLLTLHKIFNLQAGYGHHCELTLRVLKIIV